MNRGAFGLGRSKKNMKKLVLVSLLLLSGNCPANELAPAAQQEIAHLFTYLENSGCQFNRNGSWYEAREAVDHIGKKYQYLLGKNQISTSEDFIAGAATKSSMSGRPYLVKCRDAAPVESAVWFRAELEKYRQPPPKISTGR